MAKKLNTLTKVGDYFTVHRYDNGWMIEIGGKDNKDEWRTTKTVCNNEQELIDIINEYNKLEVDK